MNAATLEELREQAAEHRVQIPKPDTLAKYGLSERDWLSIVADQGWGCAICGRVPPSGRLVTDHEHVRGWKAMPPEQRALYVRGITCWTDNRFLLGPGISIDRADALGLYLRRYAARRP